MKTITLTPMQFEFISTLQRAVHDSPGLRVWMPCRRVGVTFALNVFEEISKYPQPYKILIEGEESEEQP